jgi:hypothetical protein
VAYEIIDPFEGMPEGSDDSEWLEQQGWTDFVGLGNPESAMYVRSFRRKTETGMEYIVDYWDVLYGSEYFKVDGPGELMDLLARWAPAVQAAAIVAVIDDARQFGLSHDGLVEQIAAKAAFGANDTLENRRNLLREQSRDRRRRQERVTKTAPTDV